MEPIRELKQANGLPASVSLVDTKPLGLYPKLHAIMSECGYIQKDKKNAFHGYTYASEAAIKEKLHESLVRHGVLFAPTKAKVLDRIGGLGKDGKEAVTTVSVGFEFIDVETGEKHPIEFDGLGSDQLDKGVYKAITGAIKYILTSMFLIPTGDDPEGEDGRKKTKAEQKADQKRVLDEKLQALGATPVDQPRSPKPVANNGFSEEVNPQVAAIWNRMGTKREAILDELSGLHFELTEKVGSEEASRIIGDLKTQCGFRSPSEFTVTQARQVVLRIWEHLNPPKPGKSEDGISKPVLKLWEGMVGIKATVETFSRLKAELVHKLGEIPGEQIYRDCLKKYGVEHSNQFRGGDKPRQAAREIFELINGAPK
jgi:hypothetical protein